MANEDSNKQSPNPEAASAPGGFRRSRKLAISANTVAVIVLVAAIIGMINYLSIRYYDRMDWTKTGYYSLSDKTVTLLKTLKEPVHVIVFFQPSQEVYEDVKNLLREYLNKSDKLQVEYIDPNRNLARTKQLAEEYQVSEANVVIFARGEGATRKSKYVTVPEIIEYDNSGGMYSGRPPQKKAFKGEQAFTSAIQNVLESKQPTVYFLTGHGEGDPEGFDEQFGCSTLGAYLKRENLKVSKVNFATAKQIPDDCDALVVAGPTRIPPADLEVLDRYLQNKGRMMVLLDSQKESGMNDLLQRWGVTVDNDEVIGIFSLGGMKVLSAAIGVEYNQHPIVKKLEDQNTTFPLCRSLDVETASRTPAPDRPRATWLIKSHDQFWGETDIANIKKPKFDLGADKKGPLILAAAVESGNLPGSDVTLPSTRMVVVGSSLFVSNGELPNSPANLDFFLNAVNWLINKPERVMGISPKTPQEFRLSLTEPQLQTLKLTLIVGLPGCVAVVGAIVWWRRRK